MPKKDALNLHLSLSRYLTTVQPWLHLHILGLYLIRLTEKVLQILHQAFEALFVSFAVSIRSFNILFKASQYQVRWGKLLDII